MWKWQLQSQTEENWKKQEAFTGEEDQGNDMLRNMLLDTNPYLLGITAVVSMLHTIFDILAFKNDISFFKNKKSMEGLSLRSMIVNACFSLVILLYLADNETSYMVLMSNGVGLAIEVWKISKAITVKFEGGKIEWVEAKSYKQSKTKEYDEIATSHLLFVTMPLVAGYGVYSLFFQKHKVCSCAGIVPFCALEINLTNTLLPFNSGRGGTPGSSIHLSASYTCLDL
jgi:hypothetical protein